MCSNRNNPEEFVTATHCAYLGSYNSLQDVGPDLSWVDWGRGEIGAAAPSSLRLRAAPILQCVPCQQHQQFAINLALYSIRHSYTGLGQNYVAAIVDALQGGAGPACG
jgi:hypothetical protein